MLNMDSIHKTGVIVSVVGVKGAQLETLTHHLAVVDRCYGPLSNVRLFMLCVFECHDGRQ